MKNKIDETSKKSIPLVLRGLSLFTPAGMIAGILSIGLAGVKSFFHIKTRIEKDIIKPRYVEIKLKTMKGG